MYNAIKPNSPVPAIGRLLLAAIFILSGVGKLAAPAATIAYIGSAGLPLPAVAYAGALVLELGGGLMLLAGLQTRLVALALAAFSIVAGLAFHHAIADQNQMVHLLKNIAIAGGLLQVFAFGAGAYSLDQRRSAGTAVRNA
jgi:putative oxidoreductase